MAPEPSNDHRTGWHAVPDPRNPLRNVFRIDVRGTRGRFLGMRRTYDEARSTALHYARLLDAPRHILDTEVTP